MTVASNYDKLSAIGNSAVLHVPIPWDITMAGELNVWVKKNLSPTNTVEEYKYHRLGQVTTNVAQDFASVDVDNPFPVPAPGTGFYEVTAYVTRATPEEQSYALINGAQLDPKALEAALDRAIRLIQELEKAPRLGEVGWITSLDPFEIINRTLRRETVIYFDVNGDATFVSPETLHSDGMLKTTAVDTTYGYLFDKVDHAQFEVTNPGGAEGITVKDAGLTIAKTNGLQAALDAINNYLNNLTAAQVACDTTHFDHMLGPLDDNVQKALETLDEAMVGGGGNLNTPNAAVLVDVPGKIKESAFIREDAHGNIESTHSARLMDLAGTTGSVPVTDDTGLLQDTEVLVDENALLAGSVINFTPFYVDPPIGELLEGDVYILDDSSGATGNIYLKLYIGGALKSVELA